MLPELLGHYPNRFSKPRHEQSRGVTASIWYIVHSSLTITPISFQTAMRMEHFSQPLQTSLDDTLRGVDKGRITFEDYLDRDYLGTVTSRKDW